MRTEAVSRNDLLDGLRGIAILLVITIHCTLRLPNHPLSVGIFRYVFAGTYGDISVDLFFVLSGYLITRILLHLCGKPHYFSAFYFRRACRIFPLYYLSLLIFFSAYRFMPLPWQKTFFIPPDTRWWFEFFVSNYDTDINFPYVHFWTLSLEVQFYLLWPLVVYLAKPARMLHAIAAGILVITAIRWWAVLEGVFPFTVYIRTHTRIDILMYGAIVAVLQFRHGNLEAFRGKAKRVLMFALPAQALVALFGDGLRLSHPVTQLFGYSLDGVIFASIVVLALQPKPPKLLTRICGNRFLAACGVYSFGMYIFHLPVLEMWSLYFTGMTSNLAALRVPHPIRWTIALWCLTLASSFAIGCLTWHGFEKHILKLKFYRLYAGRGLNPPAP